VPVWPYSLKEDRVPVCRYGRPSVSLKHDPICAAVRSALLGRRREVRECNSPVYVAGTAVPKGLKHNLLALVPPGQVLREAFDRTERLFRRIEALRTALAKHELAGAVGRFAMAPGYGRINERDGLQTGCFFLPPTPLELGRAYQFQVHTY